MASLTRKTQKPISERISMFESPSGSSNAASATTPSPISKTNLTKTFSKTNFGALKSQFDSGNPSQPSSKSVETKTSVSAPSSSQSQQSSAASSLASTPATTPTPPIQNSATSSKTHSGGSGNGDSGNAQKERRKLPATPKSSTNSSNNSSTAKAPVKPTGSGGRSAVVASSKQASAGAFQTTSKTPVSRTPISSNKSAHHTPLHKKSSPNSGTSSSFGGSIKQRSPTAPIPAAHAAKKINSSSHTSDKVNNNSPEKPTSLGGNISNKNNKSSGSTSINRVKAPVTKTLSSPLTPPKFNTNNVTINVNNDAEDDVGEIDEKTERLHSTTIQTTTSTIKTNQGISSVTRQQNIEVKKVTSSNTFVQEDMSYSTSQILAGQNQNRKNSDDHILGCDKSMSSSDCSDSTSPPSASPPPPPMLTPLIVPTVTVTLDSSNLNNKNIKSPKTGAHTDEVDTTVANNNFKNIVSMQNNTNMNSTAITGGRNQQYWTNQALQNDNSHSISEVNFYFHQ